jgi:hypothetical protein
MSCGLSCCVTVRCRLLDDEDHGDAEVEPKPSSKQQGASKVRLALCACLGVTTTTFTRAQHRVPSSCYYVGYLIMMMADS